nr:hypothetical protein [uncultured Clostridium sp.]
MKTELNESKENLTALCETIRDLISMQDYQTCESIICQAIGKYPHAPEPHNLIGILLEKTGDHPAAMKHFRAAWALDPTYLPARRNLECYGTFFSNGRCAYNENDCITDDNDHVIRRN